MEKSNDFQNAETSVGINANEEIQPTYTPTGDGVNQEERSSNQSSGRLRQVASVAGGAVAGAAVVMGFVVPEDTPKPPAGHHSPRLPMGPLPEVDDFDGNKVPVASHVNDEMSFSEAFNAARHETGAGGVFFWKGGVYGAYYRDEWDQLSPEYKQKFSDYPYHQPEADHAADIQSPDEPAATPAVENHPSEEQPEQEQPTADVSDREQPTADVSDGDTASTDDVEVLGVQYTELDEQRVTVASISADNCDGLLIDVDTDEDASDNGAENPDVEDISGYGIEHDDVDSLQENPHKESAPQVQPEDSYLMDNQLPDYTNNAPVEDYTV